MVGAGQNVNERDNDIHAHERDSRGSHCNGFR